VVVTAENCLSLFESYCYYMLNGVDENWLEPLRGKDLACFCKEGAPCHGDILLRLANKERRLKNGNSNTAGT
jgi:hypothetical protein